MNYREIAYAIFLTLRVCLADVFCDEGTESPDGISCMICSSGKYKSVAGTGPCTNCDTGKYRYNYPPTCNSRQTKATCETPDCVLRCNQGYSSRLSYLNNEKLTYFIAPMDATSIQLTFISMEIEANYDRLQILTCSSFELCSTYSVHSGTTLPSTNTYPSGILKIIWTSSPATTLTGWSFEYLATVPEFTENALNCLSCPPGTYNNVSGSEFLCTPCEMGKYSSDVGSSSQSQCNLCPAGSYGPILSMSSCFTCPLGQYSIQGSSSCTTCELGTYSDLTGVSSCKRCTTCAEQGAFNIQCYNSHDGICVKNQVEPYYPKICESNNATCIDDTIICDPVCKSNGKLNIKCPIGYFLYVNYEGRVSCRFDHRALPDSQAYMRRPENSEFIFNALASPTLDNSNWRCVDGYHLNFTKCFPELNCSKAENIASYNSLLSCEPGNTGGCRSDQAYIGNNFQILVSNYMYINSIAGAATYQTNTLDLISLETAQSIRAFGYDVLQANMNEYLYSNDPYDNENFRFTQPMIAQKSGANTTQVIVDIFYGTVHFFDPIKGSIKYIAGKNIGAETDKKTNDGIGSNARFFEMTTYPKAVSNDNELLLLQDNYVIKKINTTTGNVTSIVGRDGVYAPITMGTGSQAILRTAYSMSISPDKSFALIADFNIKYLNLTTNTISHLVGKTTSVGSTDGVGTSAVLWYMSTIAISHSGTFAITGDCFDYVSGSNNRYSSIRYIDIRAASATRLTGPSTRNIIGLSDGWLDLALTACPVQMAITPDDTQAYFLDSSDYNGAPYHSLRVFDIANPSANRLRTLKRFSSREYALTMSNIMLSSAKQCVDCAIGTYKYKGVIFDECKPCPAGKFGTTEVTVRPEITCKSTLTIDYCDGCVLTCASGDVSLSWYVLSQTYSNDDYRNIIIAPKYSETITITLNYLYSQLDHDILKINQCPTIQNAKDKVSCTNLYTGSGNQSTTRTFNLSSGTVGQIIWNTDTYVTDLGWSISYTSRNVFIQPDLRTCTDCPSNSTSIGGSAACTCNLGYIKSGTSCVIGVVKSCSAGYETSVDYTTCDVCREGKYKSVAGTGYCSNCSAGTYRNNPIAACNSEQTSPTCTTPYCALTCATGLVSRFGPYGNNENLVIFIAPIGATSIEIIFDTFNTEEGYDFLELRACVNIFTCDTLIARIHGGDTVLGYNGVIVDGRVNVFNTPILKVIWNSDLALVRDGWAFHYSVQTTESTPLATACLGCPISTYGTEMGAVTSFQCKACDLGKYNAVSGLSTCTDCSAGKYGSSKNTCTSCDIGKYSATNGRTDCTICAVGSYSAAGSTSCPILPPSASEYFTIMLGEAGMMKASAPCFDLTINGECVTTPYSNIASSYPESVVVHPSGTYALVAGNGIDRIFKIDLQTDVVSTFAGGNVCSGCNGIGTGAGFYQPRVVMISNSGLYAYVLEAAGCRVREINLATVQVTTIAGSASTCALDTDGQSLESRFGHIHAGTISPDDSYLLIYHEDPTCKIRKLVLATGMVTTIAGGLCSFPQNGIGTAARFNRVKDLIFDHSGSYVYMRRDLAAVLMRLNIVTNQFEIIYNDDNPGTICSYIASFGFLMDNRYMFATCWDTQNAVKLDLSTQSPSYLPTLSVTFNNYYYGEFNPLGLTVYIKKAPTTCAAGSYKSGSGCTACGAGTFTNSISEVTACTSCAPNSYANSTGSTSCLACTPCPPPDQFLMGCSGASAGVCAYCDSSP